MTCTHGRVCRLGILQSIVLDCDNFEVFSFGVLLLEPHC
jgi:hypothetical protein